MVMHFSLMICIHPSKDIKSIKYFTYTGRQPIDYLLLVWTVGLVGLSLSRHNNLLVLISS